MKELLASLVTSPVVTVSFIAVINVAHWSALGIKLYGSVVISV